MAETEIVQDERYQGFKLASITRRFFAGMIDDVIFYVVFLIVIIGSFHYIELDNLEEMLFMDIFINSGMNYVLIIFIIAHFLINYPFLRYGQTIGMGLLKIQVADVKGKVASIWKMYFLREIIFWQIILLLTYLLCSFFRYYHTQSDKFVDDLSQLSVTIMSIINIMFIFRSDRRCIHDFFAGTIVISLPQNEDSVLQKKTSVWRTMLWSSLIFGYVLVTGLVFLSVGNPDRKFQSLYRGGNLQQINKSIADGENVNVRNLYRETPLMVSAAHNTDPKVISALVEAGANVNAKNIFGMTPLMKAASTNANPEVIITLIELGANPKEKDNSGRMAIDHAMDNDKLKNTIVFRKLEEASR